MPEDYESSLPETLAAQALGAIDEANGGIVPPIHVSTTYLRDADGQYPAGKGYARADSASFDAPERLLAALERGPSCLLFASGMAAATSIFHALVPGDHVIAPRVMYFALRKWLSTFATTWGLNVELVDTEDPHNVAAALRPGRTRIVWLETPANPMWGVSDIEAIVQLAHEAHARVVVDNTVATPVFSQPLTLGADLVVHSASKYLNGHSDVLAGAIVTREENAFWQRVKTWREDTGAVLGPFEAWLLLRGMRTLFVRTRQCSESAMSIAGHFEQHPALVEVLYPGLPHHPGHEIAQRQMDGGFGGMLSIRLAGGEAAAMQVAARVEVFKRATSLGGVESLIEHRASIEGCSSPVPRDLLRLSIGIEHPQDLIADLEQALATQTKRKESPLPISSVEGNGRADTLLAKVESILERKIRPPLIDRGGDVCVTGIDEATVHLDTTGSPGAFVPLLAHIAEQIRQDVPEVAKVVFGTGDEAAKESTPQERPLPVAVTETVETQINPAVAAHGGRVAIESVKDGIVYLRFEGRCQGCALVEVTLRQGIEPILKSEFPEISAVVDKTRHEDGANPYYRPGKK